MPWTLKISIYHLPSGESEIQYTEDGDRYIQTQTYNSTSRILTIDVPSHRNYSRSIYMISQDSVTF